MIKLFLINKFTLALYLMLVAFNEEYLYVISPLLQVTIIVIVGGVGVALLTGV